jgi:hypothetical protein
LPPISQTVPTTRIYLLSFLSSWKYLNYFSPDIKYIISFYYIVYLYSHFLLFNFYHVSISQIAAFA